MDAPDHTSLEHLSELASDRDNWRKLWKEISGDVADHEGRETRGPKGGAGLGHKYNDSKWQLPTLNAE